MEIEAEEYNQDGEPLFTLEQIRKMMGFWPEPMDWDW